METLNYLRQATKAKDGKKGVAYIHRWATGCQVLIFDTHKDAERMRNNFPKKNYK